MKILIFLFLLMMTNDVQALTYYSDYSDYSTWQEEEVIENDLTEVEKEVRYKWFYEEKIYGGYEEDSEYPLIDYNDYKTSEYCTSEYRDDAIKTYFYYYKDALPIYYIYFRNIESDLTFEVLDIYAGDNKIDYEVYDCKDCLYSSDKVIGVKKDGEIILKILGYAPTMLRFNIKTTNDGVYDIYMANMNNNDYQYKYHVNNDYVELKFIYFSEVNPLYSREYKSEVDANIIKSGRVVRSVAEYCSLNRSYRRYKVVRHYSDDYMLSGNNTYSLVDNSDAKVFYRYKTRDYLTIPDNIVIKHTDIELETLIESNLPFKIETDLNKEINGEYQFIVDSPVLKVIDKVKVDILDNDTIKNLESIIENNEKQIEENTNTISSLLLEIDSLKELNKFLNNKNTLLEADNKKNSENYIAEIARLNNIRDTKVEIIEKEVDYNTLYYMGIGLVVVSVGLSFIIILKKNI